MSAEHRCGIDPPNAETFLDEVMLEDLDKEKLKDGPKARRAAGRGSWRRLLATSGAPDER